jgi:hypothetical protein
MFVLLERHFLQVARITLIASCAEPYARDQLISRVGFYGFNGDRVASPVTDHEVNELRPAGTNHEPHTLFF